MPEQATNPYQRDPWSSSDEDGEAAYVAVRESTSTVEAARAWLVKPASDGGGDDVFGLCESRRLVPEKIETRGLTVTLRGVDSLDDLPTVVSGPLMDGTAKGWWEFGIYEATEHVPDFDLRASVQRRQEEYRREEQRRAVEWRGPWWWRARCWLADRLAAAASTCDPDDRSSATWLDGEHIIVVTVRRPGRD